MVMFKEGGHLRLPHVLWVSFLFFPSLSSLYWNLSRSDRCYFNAILNSFPTALLWGLIRSLPLLVVLRSDTDVKKIKAIQEEERLRVLLNSSTIKRGEVNKTPRETAAKWRGSWLIASRDDSSASLFPPPPFYISVALSNVSSPSNKPNHMYRQKGTTGCLSKLAFLTLTVLEENFAKNLLTLFKKHAKQAIKFIYTTLWHSQEQLWIGKWPHSHQLHRKV